MKKGQRKTRLKRPKPYWNKKRARWVARVPIGDGKYRTSSHKTKPEALAAIDALWSRRAKGGDLQVLTVGAVAGQWLERGRQNWKVKTVEDYEMAVSKMAAIADVPIDFLTGQYVESMLGEIETPAMRRRVRKTLNTVMKWAVRQRYCMDNPVDQTDAVRAPVAAVQVFEADEVAAIFDNLSRHQNACRLMYALALRPGELWGLQVGDWNRKKQTLEIKRNVKEVRGIQHVETPKTASSRRVLPLGDHATGLLTAELAAAMKAGRAKKENVLFASAVGGYIRARNFQRNWRQALEDAGVEYRRIYTLRHTAATLWLNSGVSLAAVSRWLGHANITTTLRHYSHLMLDDLDEVRDFWERLG